VEQCAPKRSYSKNSSRGLSRKYWLPVAGADNSDVNKENEADDFELANESSAPGPKRRKVNNGNKLYVCKKMFLNTLGFTADKIVTTSLATTSSTGITRKDKRGQHKPKHAINEEDQQFMKSHIRSFNPQISHYRREHAPKRLYLAPELTITEMFADYLDSCKEQNRKTFGYISYSRHIKSMNISFAQLGDELCEKCQQHNVHMQSESRDESANNESSNAERVKKNKIREMKKYVEKEKLCSKENCDQCVQYKIHRQAYLETRAAYTADKDAVGENDDELYLSSDMQKVILLPRLPGFKLNLFTKRLVVLNQTFAPLNKKEISTKKALGVLWHEGISGRKDEDVASAYIKALEHTAFRDFNSIVIWVDNCSGQNKCWTLYTALAHFVNSTFGPAKIVLKYFTVGHTFMSADTFHQKVEQEMKSMKQVCDWADFLACVQKSGCAYEMKVEDFKMFENGLSQSAVSRKTRPLLDTVSVAEFRKGSTSLFFKTSHTENEFKEAIFLKKKISEAIASNNYKVLNRTKPRGVNKKKLNDIVEKLGPLMKQSRTKFFEELVADDSLDDMLENY